MTGSTGTKPTVGSNVQALQYPVAEKPEGHTLQGKSYRSGKKGSVLCGDVDRALPSAGECVKEATRSVRGMNGIMGEQDQTRVGVVCHAVYRAGL